MSGPNVEAGQLWWNQDKNYIFLVLRKAYEPNELVLARLVTGMFTDTIGDNQLCDLARVAGEFIVKHNLKYVGNISTFTTLLLKDLCKS